MINEYHKKLHPIIEQSKGPSLIWKKLIKVRELIEHQIGWQIKRVDYNFWCDNWTI